MDLYHAIKSPSDLSGVGSHSREVSPLWVQLAAQESMAPPLSLWGIDVHYPFRMGGDPLYKEVLRNNPFVSRLGSLMDQTGLGSPNLGIYFSLSGPGFSGYRRGAHGYKLDEGLEMSLPRVLFSTSPGHADGLLEASMYGISAEEYWRDYESTLEEAARAFVSAGLERGSALHMLRSIQDITSGEHPLLGGFIAGHEFAHMIFDPSITSVETAMERGHSVESISDTLARAFMRAGLFSEVVSDAFGAVSSGRPHSLLDLRYNSALFMLYQQIPFSGLPRSHAEPFRIPVIDPSVVDSTSSPLYRALRDTIQVTAEEGLRAARAGNPPEPPQQDLLAGLGGSLSEQETRRVMDEMFRYSVYSAVTSIQKLAQAYQSRSHPSPPAEARSLYELSKEAGSAVAALLNTAAGLSAEFPDWLNVRGDASTVLQHSGSRLWGLSYMVGNARPDLIGKELQIYPDRLRVAGGESLDVLSILPESVSIHGLSDDTPVHPDLYRASRVASEMYRTGLRELRGDVAQDLSADLSAEVVLGWRRRFNRMLEG